MIIPAFFNIQKSNLKMSGSSGSLLQVYNIYTHEHMASDPLPYMVTSNGPYSPFKHSYI